MMPSAHVARLLAFSTIMLGTFSGCGEQRPDAGAASASAAPKLRGHTVLVPGVIPRGAKIFFDGKPVSDVEASADGKYNIANLSLPADVNLAGSPLLSAEVPSPCGGKALIPLEHQPNDPKEKPAHDPHWLFFKVKESAWDLARVWVHSTGGQTIKIGQAVLDASKPEGQEHELFGFTCPDARKVFVGDQLVGELPAGEKETTTNYLVVADKAQTFCMREHTFGGYGINVPKSEPYKGANAYKLMGRVDFWLKDPPAEIKVEGSQDAALRGDKFTRRSLKAEACD